MNNSNYRSAKLPPHCGSCYWHDWDEDRAVCMHHSAVSDDRLEEQLLDDPVTLAELGVEAVADYAYADIGENGNWDAYDYVCDHYIKNTNNKEKRKQLNESMRSEYYMRATQILKEQ